MIIITKNSQVMGKVPTPSDLNVGELAINTYDKKLYSKHSDGEVFAVGVPPVPFPPTILSPIGGPTSVVPTIVTSDYTISNIDEHMKTQYQISLDVSFNNIVYDSGEILDLTSHTITGYLSIGTIHYIRAKHASLNGGQSNYGPSVQITTAHAIITTPTLTLSEYPNVPQKAIFNGTAFISSGNNTTSHTTTDYQVLDGAVVVQELLKSDSLLTYKIPSKSFIDSLKQYKFRMRYRDGFDICSNQSEVIATTIERPQFVIRSSQAAPYVGIWSQDIDVLVREPNLPIPDGAAPDSHAFGAQPAGHDISRDGIYVAFALSAIFNGEYIQIQKRHKHTFTKIDSPIDSNYNNPRGLAFSPNGDYLSIAYYSSPYVRVYKRSGDTFTKLPDISSLPPGIGYYTAWSLDNTYMAVCSATSPYLTIYKRNGDTFTKCTISGTLSGNQNDVAFSPDGNYICSVGYTTPYVHILKRSGDTQTKLANPAYIPSATIQCVNWSPDSLHLAIGLGATSPLLVLQKRSGDVFTRLTEYIPSPANTVRSIKYSYSLDPDDSEFLYLGHDSGNGLTKQKKTGDFYTLSTGDSVQADLGNKLLSVIPRLLK